MPFNLSFNIVQKITNSFGNNYARIYHQLIKFSIWLKKALNIQQRFSRSLGKYNLFFHKI